VLPLAVATPPAPATAAPAVACAAAPAAVPVSTRQLIAVDATRASTTYATVRLWTRSGRCWRVVAGPWTARVGRNGLSAHHREGDGTTPTGTFKLAATVFGSRPDPGVRYRYHRIVCGDWWDEDPASPSYNRFRHLPCGVRPPFRAESEGLWKATTAYRYLIPIRYNDDPPVPGRGSAIFLHLQRPNPTNGCVSLPEAQLVQTLRWLRPAARPQIAIRVE
jgi:L,D-peptidoglycan transpeptidase YkuD (ErfK/YbiS/YcfS/YnhG family)